MSESQPRRIEKPSWIILLILLPLIMWLAVSCLSVMWRKTGSESSRHKEMLKDVQVALGHYRAEYGKWPEDPALAGADSAPVRVRGRVLEALLGSNPRGIKFADFREAKPGWPGLAMESGVQALHDYWGTCYFMMLDLKSENRMPNPELMADAVTPSKISAKAPKFLPVNTLLFSAGPDRDPNTWADNICSWR